MSQSEGRLAIGEKGLKKIEMKPQGRLVISKLLSFTHGDTRQPTEGWLIDIRLLSECKEQGRRNFSIMCLKLACLGNVYNRSLCPTSPEAREAVCLAGGALV